MSRLVSAIVVLVLTGLAIGTLSTSASAATPSSGTLSTSMTTTAWTGQSYVVAEVAVPDECPAMADPANLICDHFFLTISLDSLFWVHNTGQVTIRITWASADNDFDLYVYDPNGGLAATSAQGGTTVEEVALQAPPPGTYEVRVVPFLVINSGYSGQASLIFTPGGPSPNPVWPTGGIAFAPSVVADPQRTEGEPIVHVDRDGNLWESGPWGTSTSQSFVHKSVDGGDSFHIVSAIGLRPDAPPGGGDTDIATDDQGTAYFVDLEGLVNLGAAVSNDGGHSWRKSAITVDSTAVDRQWYAIDNGPTSSASDNTVFLTFHTVGLGVQVFSSPGSLGPTDPVGGLVFMNAATALRVAPDATCGQTRFDPVNRNLYLPCSRGDHVEVIRGHVGAIRTGITFVRLAAPTSPGTGSVGDIFPGITTDTAGNVYAVWIDGKDHNVYLSVSKNQGDTWATPIHVNGDPANTNVWVWAAAGAPGIVDVVWYGTSVRGNPSSFPSWYNSRQAAATIPWFTYFAQVRVNLATPSTAAINQVRASEHPNHFGQICLGGIGCTASGGDRTMADYFAVGIDHSGAAVIVYDDTTNQHHGASLFVAKQIAGPGARGTAIVGTPPSNPMSDPSGDARFPHFSPSGVPGPNQDAMDFTRLAVSQPDANHLRIRMTVANAASLTPPAVASSIVWLTRWQSLAVGDGGEPSYRIFYAGARSDAGGTPTFFSGTGTSANGVGVPGNGCFTTTPQNCKVVLYPADRSASGSFNRGTGVITVDVPLADIGHPAVGSVLYSVTAFSFGVLPGGTPPLSLLYQDVDATRAFDFTVGSSETGGHHEGRGEGEIETDDHGGRGDFSMDADSEGHGKVAFVDTGTGLRFVSALVSSVTVIGTQATIVGTGFVNGAFTTFVAVVQDFRTPGAGSDTFSISLATGYVRYGVLLVGDISVS